MISAETNKHILTAIFPNLSDIGRSGNEVNGLVTGTVPAGKIYASFMADGSLDRVTHIVEIEGHIALLRVCKAIPGSGYDEFAVIHGIGAVKSADGIDAMQTGMRWAEMQNTIPSDVVPSIENAAKWVLDNVPQPEVIKRHSGFDEYFNPAP